MKDMVSSAVVVAWGKTLKLVVLRVLWIPVVPEALWVPVSPHLDIVYPPVPPDTVKFCEKDCPTVSAGSVAGGGVDTEIVYGWGPYQSALSVPSPADAPAELPNMDRGPFNDTVAAPSSRTAPPFEAAVSPVNVAPAMNRRPPLEYRPPPL